VAWGDDSLAFVQRRIDRGCTQEFSHAKVKKEGLVPRTQPKLGELAKPIFSPVFYFPISYNTSSS